MSNPPAIPAVSVTYAQDGTSTIANALGMRPIQERAYQKRSEQYLLIKSPPKRDNKSFDWRLHRRLELVAKRLSVGIRSYLQQLISIVLLEAH